MWHKVGILLLALFGFSSPDYANFMAVSDFHFNPYAACTDTMPCPTIEKLRQADVSQWDAILRADDKAPIEANADTNYALLTSTLAELKQRALQENPSFVIIDGDYLAHGFKANFLKYSRDASQDAYQAFVKKTYEFITNELGTTFPNTSVYLAIGNNDSYQDDYITIPQGVLFKDLSVIWSSLIKDKNNQVLMQQAFSMNGYYAVDAIPKKLRLIVLNSNLLVIKASGEGIDQAANDELTWLQNELDLAAKNNEKVMIVEHAADTEDVFASLKKQPVSIVTLYKPVYADRYLAAIKSHAAIITGILAAHVHMDWFQITTQSGTPMIVNGLPGISALFGNNPAYKVYDYDENTFALQNAQTLSLIHI